MLKFCQPMTCSVGAKTVSYTGREPFEVEDEGFRKALLAIGIFEEVPPEVEGGPALLRYSGKVTVPLKGGAEAEVDRLGFLKADKKDLAGDPAGAFR